MNYTWQVSARNKNGALVQFNIKDTAKGFRRHWYKTLESAQNAMCTLIGLATINGYTEIKWTIYRCKNDVEIIATNE